MESWVNIRKVIDNCCPSLKLASYSKYFLQLLWTKFGNNHVYWGDTFCNLCLHWRIVLILPIDWQHAGSSCSIFSLKIGYINHPYHCNSFVKSNDKHE